MRIIALQQNLPAGGTFFLLFLLPVLFFACDTYPKNTPVENLTEVITMSKGPCFGTCPVFTLTIYNNAMATFQGERFTDKQGLYTMDIGREKLRQLVAAFREANLWQYPDAFKSQIPDLQSVTITFTNEGKTKSIIGKDGRPEALLQLEEMLDDIANAANWTLKEAPDFGLPEGTIANELLVQLKPRTDGSQWVQRYAKQGMKLVKRVSPGGDYYLVSFDTAAVEPNQMLGWVQEDELVVTAEFNKQVTGRR